MTADDEGAGPQPTAYPAIHPAGDTNWTTPMHGAVLNRDPGLLRLLAVQHDPNTVDGHGRTPAHFAAQINAYDMVSTLFGVGADLDERDARRDTPLHYAARFRQPLSFAALVDFDANPTLRDAQGMTAAQRIPRELRPAFRQAMLAAGIAPGQVFAILDVPRPQAALPPAALGTAAARDARRSPSPA